MFNKLSLLPDILMIDHNANTPLVGMQLPVSRRGETVFILCLILSVLGCSSVPKPKRTETRTSTPVSSHDPFTGPPSLLAISEGAVDTDFNDQTSEQSSPRVLMLHKARRPLTVIQLWFKAGVVHEREDERGATLLLEELLMSSHDSESLRSQLRNFGAQVRSWVTLDRLIVHIEVEKSSSMEALKILGAHLQSLNERSRLEMVLNQVDQRYTSSSWIKRRLTARLLVENMNRLEVNRERPIQSPLVDADELAERKIDQLTNYIERVRHPTQTQLVIIGDLDESEVRSVISERFTQGFNADEKRVSYTELAPAGEESSRKTPEQDPLSVSVETLSTSISTIQIAIPLERLSPEEASYLDLLGFILVGEQSGLIHREAERTSVDLRGSSVRSVITDKGSVFLLSIDVSSNQVDEGWRLLLETLSGLIHQPISQRTLERAKSIFERENLLIGESLAGQARRLGYFTSHWPMSDALQRYGRAVYQARPKTLLDFFQKVFRLQQPRALIAGRLPPESDVSMWRERLSEQLDQSLVRQSSEGLVGFSQHGSKLSLLFAPIESDGVSSLTVTLPLPKLGEIPRYQRLTHIALGHWFAALISKKLINEPHFEARFFDNSLTLSATFPSSQISDVFTTLMRRLRQPPLGSERLWQAEALERSRQQAMMNLSMMDLRPQEKLIFLTQRAFTAFDKRIYPLPKERREILSRLSSSELTRWFRQYIQTQSMYVVMSGDVNELSLGRALSPLNQKMLPLTGKKRVLHETPLPSYKHTALKRCRLIKIISDDDEAWGAVSYSIPRDVDPVALLLLKSALLRESSMGDGERQLALAHYTHPHLFTIYLHSSAQSFNQKWGALLDHIDRLKRSPLSASLLAEAKRLAQRQRAQESSLTRLSADFHSNLWFRGLQVEGGVKRGEWQSKLASYQATEVQRSAEAIFKTNQGYRSFILPPYVELDSSKNCQRVVP